MSTHSDAAGQAILSSSSRGLSPIAKEYLGQAPILYEEFLTDDLSQHIEENKGPHLRHTLVRRTLITVCLTYKDMLKSKENDAYRRELHDELKKARRELAVGVGREKQLVADLKKARASEKALEMELKELAARATELRVDIKWA
ncbi:hypothetical protein ACOSQ3_002977 [Xanthoceras sorbifolium]